MTRGIFILTLASALWTTQGGAHAQQVHMPQAGDYTSMWWAEGFPSRRPAAPWLRIIQTGSYAMALDTEAMTISHFGAVPEGAAYGEARGNSNEVVKALPGAELGLRIDVDGKRYKCAAGGKWARWSGPRLIESGRFFQRADVTDLVFESEAGEILNVEARFEAAAWADRLGLVLAARPGLQPIIAGEMAFGRIGGGFGLDGGNHLEIPHAPQLDPEQFTLELWVFVPMDYRASTKAWPWLVCKNRNEATDGNFGILIVDRKAQARMNIGGGGGENQYKVESRPLRTGAWNHLAMSYDGESLRLFLNGAPSGERKVGRKRVPGGGGLAFGRRQDNSGDGYHFRGTVDEIRIYDRALTGAEVRQRFVKPEQRLGAEPVGAWGFRADGKASPSMIRETWKGASMQIGLAAGGRKLEQFRQVPPDHAAQWQEVFLSLDPVSFKAEGGSPVVVAAGNRPVAFDAARGWHRINLDGVEPELPGGDAERKNDAIERIPFTLSNPGASEQVARLMFEKTSRGIRQRIGTPITGISAILRDADGHPNGIPVQLSKNWHNDPEGGVHSGQWFHGLTQIRLPAGGKIDLELVLVYGHWGGVAAASHAQLSLVGWGGNQLWEQSALGAWGESICYDPDQAQANCTITDVRPLMVRPMGVDGRWEWTSNVGGGDFFRFFAPAGERVAHSAMRTTYFRQGPCLTEVRYAGRLGRGITHSATVSLGRGDDLVRGVYRLRLDVEEATEFSRFAIFQVGADTYNSTGERKMAIGSEVGLAREWQTQWGGNVYRTEPQLLGGRIPWISLHEGVRRANQMPGAWANRGIVIREWRARLGGKEAEPWGAERGLTRHLIDSSTFDILPPPGLTRLEPGDFIEATIEHIAMPQSADDYYGPNAALSAALQEDANTWRMIRREAVDGDRAVKVATGELLRTYPDLRIRADNDRAKFTIAGGIGFVPISFTGLRSSSGYELRLDGKRVDQSVHGNDFWQTDYDPLTRSWSRTYNVRISAGETHAFGFARAK